MPPGTRRAPEPARVIDAVLNAPVFSSVSECRISACEKIEGNANETIVASMLRRCIATCLRASIVFYARPRRSSVGN
jgi:hypothetical protein